METLFTTFFVRGPAMKKHASFISVISFALILLFAFGVSKEDKPVLPAPDKAQIQSFFDNLPLHFLENRGQVDNMDVAYYVQGYDKILYFTPKGVTFALRGKEEKRWVVNNIA